MGFYKKKSITVRPDQAEYIAKAIKAPRDFSAWVRDAIDKKIAGEKPKLSPS